MKYLYIDTETGGVDADVNPVIQIAGAVEIDGIVKERFDFFIKPFANQICEDEALNVTGITREQIETFEDPKDVYKKFSEILGKYVNKFKREDKFFFIAYNARFDMDFIRKFFINNDDTYLGSWFYFPPLDVMALWGFLLARKRSTMTDFKLLTVAREAGLEIDESKLHDAQYDIELTRHLLLKARERFKK